MMTIHIDTLLPEAISDDRLRNVFVDLKNQAHEPVRPCHFVASVVRQRDPTAIDILANSLIAGCAPLDLLRAAEDLTEIPSAQLVADRDKVISFSPAALEGLRHFEELLGTIRQPRQQLELMLACMLRHWGAEDGQSITMLNTERAIELFEESIEANLECRVEAVAQPDETTCKTSDATCRKTAMPLPPEVAPSENVTARIQDGGRSGVSPYESVSVYEAVFEAISRVLHRKSSGHVLLVGERGVGRTALFAELARRAASGWLPFLKSKTFLTVDCRYTAPDESGRRIAGIFQHLGIHGDLVVGLEGFASLLQGERSLSSRKLLLSFLARSHCRIIGLLTPQEYESLIADDPECADYFTRIDVPEPDQEHGIKLLKFFAAGLKHAFGVQIDDAAITQSVILASNYILNESLPGSALRVLQRVCEEARFDREQLQLDVGPVTVDDVFRSVSELIGIPEQTLRGIADRTDYDAGLGELVVGQEEAVREVAKELKLIKAGFTDVTKPASVMLFVGQTGTGKTEMAKALARFYSTSKKLRTYTLGNFVEPHSVAGIIGVPPGYVGHDQGGRMINDLNSDPYCVFLLDEADKAHPDVMQPFLNLFDEGWIRDQRGVQANANKSIFLLTTNVGQRMISDMIKKGKKMEEIARRMKEALSEIRHGKSNRPVFTPEFLARIKRIIVFQPLDRDAMEGICRKLIGEMQRHWHDVRAKELVIPDSLVQHIAEQAHERNQASKHKEGGRIVRKLLAELVEIPMQAHIADHGDQFRRTNQVVVRWGRWPNDSEEATDRAIRIDFTTPSGARLDQETSTRTV